VSQHPNWVIDLIVAVEEYEFTHPQDAHCFQAALMEIPDEVRNAVRAVAEYKRETERQEQP
jgi:hypothetical protein